MLVLSRDLEPCRSPSASPRSLGCGVGEGKDEQAFSSLQGTSLSFRAGSTEYDWAGLYQQRLSGVDDFFFLLS